jgi:signal transduction histidine kinase
MAEAKVPRREVVVRTSIEPGLPMIEGDHHQLSQVFTNLIANAFEALDGRGSITISMATAAIEADPAFAGIHPPAPAVLVEVADDGPGVPANLTDRIFNPFFTTKVTGTGLGLAIVRKIVDAHDGRIDVNSSPDTGTRFRVTLPVSSASGWFK